MKNKSVLILLLVLLFLQSSNSHAKLIYIKRAYPMMGSVLSIELWSKNKNNDFLEKKEDYFLNIFNKIDQVNIIASHYKDDSELSVFNKTRNQWFAISKDFYKLLDRSRKTSIQSKSYFNPFVVSYMNNDLAEVKKSRLKAFHKLLKLKKTKEKYFVLKKTYLQVNLSANAKGYALNTVEKYLNALKEKNILSARIILGEQAMLWSQDSNKKWEVYVRHPKYLNQTFSKLLCSNGSISTSARYGKVNLKKSKQHIVNPKKINISVNPKESNRNINPKKYNMRVNPKKINMNNKEGNMSVTVFHTSSYQADVLSTLLFMFEKVGKNKIDKIKKKYDFYALIHNNEHVNEWTSDQKYRCKRVEKDLL